MLLTLGIEYPISSVSFVVQWKTLSGTVLATLCTSWITAWKKPDIVMVCKQQRQPAQTQAKKKNHATLKTTLTVHLHSPQPICSGIKDQDVIILECVWPWIS